MVEDYSYIARRLREITKSEPVKDDADADAANEPDEDDFGLGYMCENI